MADNAVSAVRQERQPRIAAVIPCYRERNHILDVITAIGPEVGRIYVVDDACPDATGKFVQEQASDPRLKVLFHAVNQGVGGATITGYREALADGFDIAVKIDGDGQMDGALIPALCRPILDNEADYSKGNRLHRYQAARGMPAMRLFGNMALTLFSKVSSGYWTIMDPTNGFTAVHAAVLRELPLDDIAKGFFFESDVLFRLGGLEAVVCDVPMQARYGTEQSHLSVRRIFWEFLGGHAQNAFRRIVDTYFVRDVGIASLELLAGSALAFFGFAFGAGAWYLSEASGIPATAGTVFLAALPIILGMQLLLAFLGHDTRRVPSRPIHPGLTAKRPAPTPAV